MPNWKAKLKIKIQPVTTVNVTAPYPRPEVAGEWQREREKRRNRHDGSMTQSFTHFMLALSFFSRALAWLSLWSNAKETTWLIWERDCTPIGWNFPEILASVNWCLPLQNHDNHMTESMKRSQDCKNWTNRSSNLSSIGLQLRHVSTRLMFPQEVAICGFKYFKIKPGKKN